MPNRILRTLVETGWGWAVIGEARDGLEAAMATREVRPDVVLAEATVRGLALAGELVGPSTVLVGLTHSPPQRLGAAWLQVSKTLPVRKMREDVGVELERRGAVTERELADGRRGGGIPARLGRDRRPTRACWRGRRRRPE